MKTRMIVFISISAVIHLVISILPVFKVLFEYGLEDHLTGCSLNWRIQKTWSNSIYMLFVFAFVYFGPLAVIITYKLKLIRKVISNKVIVSETFNPNSDPNKDSTAKKVAIESPIAAVSQR
jgi:hypothetical protein